MNFDNKSRIWLLLYEANICTHDYNISLDLWVFNERNMTAPSAAYLHVNDVILTLWLCADAEVFLKGALWVTELAPGADSGGLQVRIQGNRVRYGYKNI